MKKNALVLLSTWVALPFLAGHAYATEQEITIAGTGGIDVAIVHKLINDVVADELKAAGIKINYVPIEGDYPQYLFNSLSAKTAPDAFYVDIVFADPLIKSGNLAAVEPSLQPIVNSILPSLNQPFTVADKQYGIAKDFNTLALQFNKDIFDDAAVAYPTDEDNWEQLREKLVA
ncbi:MAG: hypothetical protein ACRCYV_10855, partial [Aeromonas sp.]